jgi:hypothetical protein
MSRRLLIFCCLLLSAALPARAERVPVYEAEVPSGGEITAPEPLLKQALSEVLVKATGNAAWTLPKPPQPRLLALAPQLVQQSGTRSHEGVLHFWALFDEQAVNRALREAGIAVWPPERPATLLLLAVSDGGSKPLSAADPALLAQLPVLARQRGLAVLPPQPQAALEWDRLNAATQQDWMQQQGAQAALSGRLSRTPEGQTRIQWTFTHAGESSRADSGAADVAAALARGVELAASTLARRYTAATYASGAAGGGAGHDITVLGIQQAAAYVRAVEHLKSLSLVAGVQPLRLEPDRAVFRLQLRSDAKGLAALLATGGVLQPAVGEEAVFKLQPATSAP